MLSIEAGVGVDEKTVADARQRDATGVDATPTMADVAQTAGLSIATVSRVLSGRASVAPDYRTRVIAAVAALGYRPNRLARNLRRKSTDMIGIVISDIENAHFSEMTHVAEDEAYRRGYRVLLCNTDESSEKQATYLRMLGAERPLGVILSPCDSNGPEIGELLDLGIPIVAFDRPVDDPEPMPSSPTTSRRAGWPSSTSSAAAVAGSATSGSRPRSRLVPAGWPVTGPHWPTPAWNRIGRMAACGWPRVSAPPNG